MNTRWVGILIILFCAQIALSDDSGGMRGVSVTSESNAGEVLYNGIVLPAVWPPINVSTNDTAPIRIPYLENPPSVVPIDIGRQLFVDDFLIAETTLSRVFHKPEKYKGNPVLKPETALELNEGGMAVAAPKSGGVWWDPEENLFKMWYEAGWYGTVCMATSRDGLNWTRPELDVVDGTNQILPVDLGVRPDSWTVVRNWDASSPEEKWTLYLQPPGTWPSGWALASPDGIHWNRRTPAGFAGDRSTHHYNPFRKKWVFSLRTAYENRGRSREYIERDDFMGGVDWKDDDKVIWLMTDDDDPVDYLTQIKPQLYNLDAVAYESIMLGMFQIWNGPENKTCHEAGLPKITELMFAYSRDGFHWHRPDRRAHIPAERSDVWDRGYVQSVGNICTVRGDKLWIYYIGFQGNEDLKTARELFLKTNISGAYDRGATGVAFLRRDGFVSMEAAGPSGFLTTRPVTFSGKYLFVNADVPAGSLRAEIRDVNGNPIVPFTLSESVSFSGDSTIEPLRWKNGSDLSVLKGQPVVIHFEVGNGALYSFWVSKDHSGRSDGYVAGAGPGFTGPTDTAGISAYNAEYEQRQDVTRPAQ